MNERMQCNTPIITSVHTKQNAAVQVIEMVSLLSLWNSSIFHWGQFGLFSVAAHTYEPNM
jgi:hypothetical protein